MTPQEFIENAPLYTRIEIIDFEPPNSITLLCTRCKKETTWLSSGKIDQSVNTDPKIYFKIVGYTCCLCDGTALRFSMNC